MWDTFAFMPIYSARGIIVPYNHFLEEKRWTRGSSFTFFGSAVELVKEEAIETAAGMNVVVVNFVVSGITAVANVVLQAVF